MTTTEEKIGDGLFLISDDTFGRHENGKPYLIGTVFEQGWSDWRYRSKDSDTGNAPTRELATIGLYDAVVTRATDIIKYRDGYRFRVNIPLQRERDKVILELVSKPAVRCAVLTKTEVAWYTRTVWGARWLRYIRRARTATILEFNQYGGTYAEPLSWFTRLRM
jgi:hypothetical protein